MVIGTAVAPSSRMTRQPDEDVIVYECGEFWEIRLGDELHGLRFTLEAALARAQDVAAFHRKSWNVRNDFGPLPGAPGRPCR